MLRKIKLLLIDMINKKAKIGKFLIAMTYNKTVVKAVALRFT